ncbi:chaperonin 10-like protein [Mycena galopus ATCC 62051]|nr:chaperonin 10-like protein [Mycena galopus ATCC 62051]
MVPKTNGRVLFNSSPADYPVPGETVVYDTSQTIDIETYPLNGAFLVKTLVLSIDPYMHGRMSKPDKSYIARAPFAIGEPIVGFGIGVVVRSENSEVPAGKYIYGIAEYFILADITEFIFLEKNSDLSWSVYLGAAGMLGKTAFAGWKEYSHAKKVNCNSHISAVDI